MVRAASTRCRMEAEGSASSSLPSFSNLRRGNLYIEVDAVEQGAADLLLVFYDLRGRTGAVVLAVAEVAAGAGVHAGDERELGWESERALGAADGDDAVLQRLAQVLQDGARELGQFVEEEDTAVRQADLARAGKGTAADEGGGAGAVVRGAEGAGGDERLIGGKQAGDGIDLGDFQRFFLGHLGEDGGGWRARESVLPVPGGPLISTLCPAAGRDLQRPFHMLLSFDIGHVDGGAHARWTWA